MTFTPQDGGFTDWHWTLIREGQTYTEEGRGIFLRGKPKSARRARVKKVAPRKKAATRRKAAPKKKARKPAKVKKAKRAR